MCCFFFTIIHDALGSQPFNAPLMKKLILKTFGYRQRTHRNHRGRNPYYKLVDN